MEYTSYGPEGTKINTPENREYISSLQGLEKAMLQNKILESNAIKCDEDMNIYVDLFGIVGIIEKKEVIASRKNESVKDIAIITRVGKPICFKVLSIDKTGDAPKVYLSRREAQRECINNYFSDLIPGDIIKAKVTHLDKFGAFVDIGCGISSLLSIDCISVSRISHPKDRLSCGDIIDVIIKSLDEDNERIFVTRRELLGTWEENVACFSAGQTVAGIVRSVESYGIFVELAPNLAGLAEIRDESSSYNIHPGQSAAVYIKSIIPERMKVKLVLIDASDEQTDAKTGKKDRLFIDTDKISHIDYWRYSPPGAPKTIETLF